MVSRFSGIVLWSISLPLYEVLSVLSSFIVPLSDDRSHFILLMGATIVFDQFGGQWAYIAPVLIRSKSFQVYDGDDKMDIP